MQIHVVSSVTHLANSTPQNMSPVSGFYFKRKGLASKTFIFQVRLLLVSRRGRVYANQSLDIDLVSRYLNHRENEMVEAPWGTVSSIENDLSPTNRLVDL